jgi:hypothetical protein
MPAYAGPAYDGQLDRPESRLPKRSQIDLFQVFPNIEDVFKSGHGFILNQGSCPI